MSKQSSVVLSVTVAGDGISGLVYVPPQYAPQVNPSAPGGGPDPLVLTAGANVVPVRPGSVGYIISPPTQSTNLKIVNDTGAGATGLSFKANCIVGTIDNAQANLYVNSVIGETVSIFWF